ncbi:hypothetical protein FRB97_007523 [Tulasnella sp. 331]|nr:hypothetical protein FRB97_007523 [Tulasnella sp. 331]
MRGKWYRRIQLKEGSSPTPEDLAAYQEMHPALLNCFEAWKVNQDASQWNLSPCSGHLLFAKFKGEGSERLKALFMPKVLDFRHAMWRVGWEHQRGGSLKDPLQDLANGLIELLDAGRLHDILVVRQMDPAEDSPKTTTAAKPEKDSPESTTSAEPFENAPKATISVDPVENTPKPTTAAKRAKKSPKPTTTAKSVRNAPRPTATAEPVESDPNTTASADPIENTPNNTTPAKPVKNTTKPTTRAKPAKKAPKPTASTEPVENDQETTTPADPVGNSPEATTSADPVVDSPETTPSWDSKTKKKGRTARPRGMPFEARPRREPIEWVKGTSLDAGTNATQTKHGLVDHASNDHFGLHIKACVTHLLRRRDNSLITSTSEIHPALRDCFEAWKARQDASQWDFTLHDKHQLIFARFKGRNSKNFKALYMPNALRFESNMWRVGWQHRNSGSLKDPLEDLANGLIELLESGKLCDILVVQLREPAENTSAIAIAKGSAKQKKRRPTPKPNAEASPYPGCEERAISSILNVATGALQIHAKPAGQAREDYLALEIDFSSLAIKEGSVPDVVSDTKLPKPASNQLHAAGKAQNTPPLRGVQAQYRSHRGSLMGSPRSYLYAYARTDVFEDLDGYRELRDGIEDY